MREPIQEGGGHLGVAGEDVRPLTEGEIGRHQDGSLLVEPADEVEEQLPSGLRKGQVTAFVQDHEVDPGEIICDPPLPARAALRLSRLTRSTTLKKRPRAP